MDAKNANDQKRLRLQCYEQLLKSFDREGEQFMKRTVTVDETWISLYTPETKAQSTMWKIQGSSSPKKLKTNQSAKKLMFDAGEVVLAHAVPQGFGGCPHTIRRSII